MTENNGFHAVVKWFITEIWIHHGNLNSSRKNKNPWRGKKACLFVCLFVCLGKTRKSILRSLCLEGSNNPWEWLHTESGTEIELYPRRSCFQHENRPENTPRPRAWHKEHCGADLIRHGPRVRTLWRRFNQTRTTCINQWLTLYKLTGWLASLDLRKPHTKRILNHRNNHPLRLNILL